MKEGMELYWIWLAARCGVESKELTRLLDLVGDPFELYRMETEELEQLPRISRGLKERLADKTLSDAYDILRYCKENRVTVLTYEDSRYPMRLRDLEAPPAVLYLRGRVPEWNNRLCIGMVGTRTMSEYGKQSAYTISYELASAGAIIVSGMALGVDGVSACGALSAKGCTVAVLGCGIDVVYPKHHTKLMRGILERGTVITEYPPKTKPLSFHFPQRNRIISGLCAGLLVVEGTLKSGSMITAKAAVSQGRDLFALPGQIGDPNSEGPVSLIRGGAYVARGAEDILNQYAFLYKDVLSLGGLARARARDVGVEHAMKQYGVSDYYGERETKKQSRLAAETEAEPKPQQTRSEKKKKAVSGEDATPTPTQSAVEGVTEEAWQAQRARSPILSAAMDKNPADPAGVVLSSLDSVAQAVYHALPDGRAFSPDQVVGTERTVHDVVTSLTILQIGGLVEPLPGGQYRKSDILKKNG